MMQVDKIQRQLDEAIHDFLGELDDLKGRITNLESGVTVKVDRRKGQRRTFEWMRRRKPERRK